MQLQVLDAVSGVPIPLAGVGGKVIISLPANSAAIIPTDAAGAYLSRPVQLWVGGAGDVTVIPYGLEGDKSVTFPGMAAGAIVPVLVKQVLATGTSATALRGQW